MSINMNPASAFPLTLLSNVSSNQRNKADDFETRLAHPLRLMDEWEVALCDVCYPEEWNHTGH